MNVYFVKAMDSAGLIKIGKAKDIASRIAELQTGSSASLELMGSIQLHSEKHAKHVEARLHRTFSRYRVRGEWYRAGKPLTEFISALNSGSKDDALSALQLMN